MMMISTKKVRLLLVALAVAVGATWGGAQPVDEQKAAALKAAYLRSLAEFTSWPKGTFEGKTAPIVIGVAGEDRFGIADLLEEVVRTRNITAQGHSIRLVRIAYAPTSDDGAPAKDVRERKAFVEQLRQCHVVFVTRSEEKTCPEIVRLLAEVPVLTVSEVPGFARGEGMIECAVARREGRSKRVGIDLIINLGNVRREGLKISSRLLGLKQGVQVLE